MSELKSCWHCGKPARYADKTPTMENPQGVDLKRCKCSERRCIGSKLCVEVDVWNTRHIDDQTRREIEAAVLRRVALEWKVPEGGLDDAFWSSNDVYQEMIDDADRIERGE